MAKILLKSRLVSTYRGHTPCLLHILTWAFSPQFLYLLAQHAKLLPVCFLWQSEESCSSFPSSGYSSAQHTCEIRREKKTWIGRPRRAGTTQCAAERCSAPASAIPKQFFPRSAVTKFGGRNLGPGLNCFKCVE